MNPPRLIIVDDSALIRQAIEMVLDLRYDVVASVSNGEAAVTAAARLTPELILLDISMPGVNGFEAARQIKRASSVTSIIFVSEHEQKSYVEAGFGAGASGYVFKDQIASDLVPAIRTVLAGSEFGRLAT